MTPSRVAVRILLVLGLSLLAQSAFCQELQVQVPQERTLAAGQSDQFRVALQKGQFLSLTVVQKGIDVGITVIDPDGIPIRVVDSADGSAGIEALAIVAASTGSYKFDVHPVDVFRNPPPGRYEIKIVEIRNATDQELRDGTRVLGKTQGLTFLSDIERLLQEVHDPLTRARFQIQSADFLWNSDDARAFKIIQGAGESLNEIFSGRNATSVDADDFRSAMELRRNLIESVIPRQPEAALSFLRSTRVLMDPDNVSQSRQSDERMEVEVANRIAQTNPQRGFQIAEEVLKEGPIQELMDVVRVLQPKSPNLATNLARDITRSLLNQRVLTDASTANLAGGLVRFAQSTSGNGAAGGGSVPFISSAEYASFYQNVVSEVLAYIPPDSYTVERHAALTLVRDLTQQPDQLQNFATDKAPALMQKLTQLDVPPPAAPNISSVSVERGLSLAAASTTGARDSLYEQAANTAALEGDINRAQQIINDYLPPSLRSSALNSARRTAVSVAAARGDFGEALRLIQSERSAEIRVSMLQQVVSQIAQMGPNLKNSTMAALMEAARGVLDPSARAEGIEEMRTLLKISAALARINPDRASDIIQPLVDQFNDLSLAAKVSNGFREKSYKNGDLMMEGNSLAILTNEFANALTTLALTDILRAKATADRMQPVTSRIEIYLQIAGKAGLPARSEAP
jgi:hypothetical protein